MTREEFQKLPYLLTQGQAVACGYSSATLSKYGDCNVLNVVLPAGCTQRRYQKRQLAQLLGWETTLDLKAWAREKPLMTWRAVCQWTGYSDETLSHIIKARGLTKVQPGGIGSGKYRKDEIGRWLGF